ncbi:MAG: hypothetical protein HY268_33185 [Deltaproteobacteria bacterium]|nr:hypothetical protein [Deltaproteobacteria bacterium]
MNEYRDHPPCPFYLYVFNNQQSSESIYFHPKRLCREDLAQFCITRLFVKRFDKRGKTHIQAATADTKRVGL